MGTNTSDHMRSNFILNKAQTTQESLNPKLYTQVVHWNYHVSVKLGLEQQTDDKDKTFEEDKGCQDKRGLNIFQKLCCEWSLKGEAVERSVLMGCSYW